MFISFEGPEGSGKSTQIKKLGAFLEEKGLRVLLTQEPGGTEAGKVMRAMLLDPAGVLDPMTEIYLFAADRCEHVKKIIQPALSEGKIVITDRFVDSTIAYQVGGRSLPEDLVRYVNMVSSLGLMPDLTILLDISPQIGIERATRDGGPDRFEKEKIDFHARVRKKYLEGAKNDPQRIKVVSTDRKSAEEVQGEIRRMVKI